MSRTRGWSHIRRALLLAAAAAAFACRSSPTEVARVNGVFQLAVFDGLPLPVNLGVTPPGTCARRIVDGALTLNAATQKFSYIYEIRDCQDVLQPEGGSQANGSYVQSGSSLDFNQEAVHYAGEIRADRIIVVNGGATLEFLR